MCHGPPARSLSCCRSSRAAARSERDPWWPMDSRYWRQSSLGPGDALAPPDDCWPAEWLGVGLAVGSLLAVPSTPFDPGLVACGAALVAPELLPSTPGCPLPPENTPASAMPPDDHDRGGAARGTDKRPRPPAATARRPAMGVARARARHRARPGSPPPARAGSACGHRPPRARRSRSAAAGSMISRKAALARASSDSSAGIGAERSEARVLATGRIPSGSRTSLAGQQAFEVPPVERAGTTIRWQAV